jgi:hypothetical protein
MRSLLRSIGSGVISRGGANDSPRMSLATATDPAGWHRAFIGHWQTAASIMDSSQRAAVTQEHIDSVFRHLDEMAFLLLTEVFGGNFFGIFQVFFYS